MKHINPEAQRWLRELTAGERLHLLREMSRLVYRGEVMPTKSGEPVASAEEPEYPTPTEDGDLL